jgi:hypothetical protein
LGAPPEILVNGKGEPMQPLRSAIFGIRRFKQKSFSFAAPKDKAGRFTGVPA